MLENGGIAFNDSVALMKSYSRLNDLSYDISISHFDEKWWRKMILHFLKDCSVVDRHSHTA